MTILLFGLLCGFIGRYVRFTKEEPLKLSKEQNTDLKDGSYVWFPYGRKHVVTVS